MTGLAVPLAAPRRRRDAFVLVLSVAILCAAMVLALCVGRFGVPPGTTLAILASKALSLDPAGTDLQNRIIILVRAPRVLMTVMCGAGLALAGAALQGVFRNPLVSPHILGVSSGASFGGAVAILLGLSGVALMACSFLAGSAAFLLVGMLARVEGRSGAIAIVLTGIVIGALFSALVSLAQFVADPETSLPAIVFWLMGSFAITTWSRLAIAAPAVLAGIILIMGLRFRIAVLSLGDEDARALGLPVERDRWLVFLAVALIEGTVVAFAGVVGWIGLVVPHVARLIVGPDQRILLPASALFGAIYLLLIDTLARSATAAEIPLGIITAIIGAPVFAILLRRSRKRHVAE